MTDTLVNAAAAQGELPGSSPATMRPATTPATDALSLGTMPLAEKIAQAVASGLVSQPEDSMGWEKLIQQFQNGGPVPGTSPVTSASSSSTNSTDQLEAALGSGGVGATPASGALGAFLNAIKQHESGGNYGASNAAGGVSGAYQFTQSTWDYYANASGYGAYVGKAAGQAPPQVQDAVAGYMAQQYFNEYGSWQNAAEAWYEPSMAGKAGYQNTVPSPGAGNTLTVGEYGQQIVSAMGQQQGQAPPLSPTTSGDSTSGAGSAVSFARSQLGVPYQWGGEAPGKYFDCSGLVQAAYAAAGVSLPRTAQEQYDATQKVPNGVALQPGDLVFFGSSTKAVSHVGIYVGNNQMIDAPHTGADVRVESYQWGNFLGATRPSDPTGASVFQQAGGTSPLGPSSSPVQSPSAMSLGAYYTALNSVISALAGLGPAVGGAVG